MSHSKDYEDSGPTTAYYQGVEAGIIQGMARSLDILEDHSDKCPATEYDDSACYTCRDFYGLGAAISLLKKAQNDS